MTQSKSQPRLLLVVLLTVVATTVAIVGILGIGKLFNNPVSETAPTQPPVVEATEPTKPINTQEPAPEPSPTLTSSPTLTPSPTIPAQIELAFRGVARNDDWQPYIEIINGVEMALVPAGCFDMGSTVEDAVELCGEQGTESCGVDRFADEEPVHTVCFDEPFWIDVYEVTNGQYGYSARGVDSMGEPCLLRSYDDEQPRICIDWYDALAYCESRGARLPTEAEWEYAARGPDGLTYPWGNDYIAENVVVGSTSNEETWKVGSKPGGASWVGAFDLSGNVWEWLNDWYNSIYYQTLEDGVVNPQGPNSGDWHVLRGGAWYNGTDYIRATNRDSSNPARTNNGYGFRCAVSYLP
ncbi:MAG: SUMF1/EgtB/PvdO family nonheme iron enzyme [Anaerolineae bacterium]|nr:SUMF1/EgtB/PvdO family nonheme iron enzyme [Anaerolineae bacterium]